VRILVNQVPYEGLVLREEADPVKLDLETELIKFSSPLKLEARAFKINNALTVDLKMKASLHAVCSRCLEDFPWELNKEVRLNYPLDSSTSFIELDNEIREEVILDYPIKPLCNLKCKGLCQKCGSNLNQGGCNCATT